jgi:type II secretion system protein C
MHSASSISSALFRLDVGVFQAGSPTGADPSTEPEFAGLIAAICNDDALPQRARILPRLVSFALAALIAAEILHMVAPPADRGWVALPRSPVNPPVANAATSGVDVSRILSAHLFGDLRPEPPVQDSSSAPLSVSSLSLVGTIATPIPAVGMAIIGNQGQFKVYAVGDRIGDASLHLVYLDRVVLDRHGSLELLVLPRAWPGARHSAGAPGALASAASPGDWTPGPEQPQATIVGRVANSKIEEDGSGAVLGIRVVPGQDKSTFIRSGLIGGDVVVAVNGTKLDGSDRSQEIWNQVSTGTTVTVLRRGQMQDVTLNFAP